jgi:hypothetical protein
MYNFKIETQEKIQSIFKNNYFLSPYCCVPFILASNRWSPIFNSYLIFTRVPYNSSYTFSRSCLRKFVRTKHITVNSVMLFIIKVILY